MIRILLISGTWPPARCGVGRYAERYYSQLLDKPNLDISVLTSSEYISSLADFFGVEGWRLRDLGSMVKNIRKVDPDIVHIQYPTRAYKRQLGINCLPLILRLMRIPVIVTMHEYFQTSLLGRMRSSLTIWPASRIVVSNEADFTVLPSRLNSRLSIIPIGPTIASARSDKKRFLEIISASGLDKSRQTAVFFGLPFANKRLEVLLDATRQFSKRVQLLLPIETDEQNDYATSILAKAKELQANGAPVGITGFLSEQDLPVVLDAAEYFVLPQIAPPLTAKSSTAIAAAESGCVTIAAATNPRRLSQPFVSGKNCCLLDDTSPKSIAKAINELVSNPTRRQKLAGGATELRKYFDWDNITQKYIKLYKELAK